MNYLKIILASFAFLAFIGCESQADKDLESVRACSDSATKLAFTGDNAGSITKAKECDSFIQTKNLTSKEALQIQFGILIMAQGKISQMANMVTAMKSAGASGTNSLNGALSFLAFDSRANAERISTIGNQLGGGAQLLAALIKMATILSELTSLVAGDPTAVKTAISACSTGTCSAEQKTQIAGAAIAYQAGACADPKDQTSTDPNNNCYKAKQITNGSTDTDTIINNLKNLANTQS